MWRWSVAGGEATYGHGHIQTLMSLVQLASLLTSESRPPVRDDAEHARQDAIEGGELFHRALEGYEALYGPDHPKTLQVVWSLALHLYFVEKYAEAAPPFHRALDGFAAHANDRFCQTRCRHAQVRAAQCERKVNGRLRFAVGDQVICNKTTDVGGWESGQGRGLGVVGALLAAAGFADAAAWLIEQGGGETGPPGDQ